MLALGVALGGAADTDLMLKAAREALDRHADDAPVAWTNPATSHRGDVTVARRFESGGNPCRELRIRNETRNRSGEAFATACRIDGQWRLLGDSQLD